MFFRNVKFKEEEMKHYPKSRQNQINGDEQKYFHELELLRPNVEAARPDTGGAVTGGE
jgi:hypothetical protein